jgi:hypothetical protein
VLDVPAQTDQRRRLLVLRGELEDGRVLERVLGRVCVGRPLPVDPAVGDHAWVTMPLAAWKSRSACWVKKRVQLDLVDGRHDIRLTHEVLEMLRAEVGDPDRTRASDDRCAL